MPQEKRDYDMARRAMELSRQISIKLQPMLKGHPPELQGAVLADLAAVWLAGHAPIMREEILQQHVQEIRGLIVVNEKIMFDGKGHPAVSGITYAVRVDGKSITCLRCGKTSYHSEDVRNRYCGHCKVFHNDDRTTP